MPTYIDVDADRLSKIHEGLELIEALDRAGDGSAMKTLALHLYGITNDPQVLDAAREAIADEENLAEQDVQLSEVAVAIRLSADTIYALMGSGIRARREEFAYRGSGGEGIRSLSFAFSHYKPQISLSAFSKLALASSNGDLYDFLAKEGTGQQAKVTPNVRRTEEATQPGTPPAAPTPAPAMPKQTSLSSFLDDFLD